METLAERVARLEEQAKSAKATAEDVEELKEIVSQGRGIKWVLGMLATAIGWLGIKVLHLL